MAYQNNSYNYNNQASWKKTPVARKKSDLSAGKTVDDYQRFLEYLEQSGQAKNFQKKLNQATILRNNGK